MKKISFASSPLSLDDIDLLVVPVFPPFRGGRKKNSSRTTKKERLSERFDLPTRKLLRKLDELTKGAVGTAIRAHEFAPQPRGRLDIVVPWEGRKKGAELAQQRFIRLSSIMSAVSGGENRSIEDWRRLAGDAVESAKRFRVKRIGIWVDPRADELSSVVTALVEGLRLGAYGFDRYKSNHRRRNSAVLPSETTLFAPQQVRRNHAAVQLGETTAEAVALARDLVNTPPSNLLPVDLVRVARKIARQASGIRVQAYGKAQLKRMGTGGILSVSRGSSSEPFLIHLSFTPHRKEKNSKRVVLIGKGVTFDSGGLSIKPGKGMEDMKCDMAGAAAVLGTIRAISQLPKGNFLHELHVIVPTTENMVSADSFLPGDVLFCLNGKSVEVLNTDAEGRLILADALAYAAKLDPHLIVDLATLTGACVVALGNEYAGLFTNNEELEAALKDAAYDAGELIWPLPLAKEYRSQLDSSIADLRNIGSGGPGATLGALFLQEFVPDNTPWAHLDIAGPAFLDKGNEYTPRGGTGFGVRTLVRFLLNLDRIRL